MLIVLHQEMPHIVCTKYAGALVVEFARYRSWGDVLDRGVRLIDKVPHSTGTLFRVSLHYPTIYKVTSLCKTETSTWQTDFTLLLMEGSPEWVLEVNSPSSKFTVELDGFDASLKVGSSGSTSLWDHLGSDS